MRAGPRPDGRGRGSPAARAAIATGRRWTSTPSPWRWSGRRSSSSTSPEVAELDINPLLADERRRHRPRRANRGRRGRQRAAQERLAIRPYPKELEQEVTLADGRRLCCGRSARRTSRRWWRPSASSTPEDVRLRFFAPLKELTHASGGAADPDRLRPRDGARARRARRRGRGRDLRRGAHRGRPRQREGGVRRGGARRRHRQGARHLCWCAA